MTVIILSYNNAYCIKNFLNFYINCYIIFSTVIKGKII